MRVAIFHPDLGIGGAERLIVDTAISLQARGHFVVIYTSHHAPSHCFEETKNGTVKIVVHGDWIPRTIFNMFSILFATIRSLWLALCFYFLHQSKNYDIIMADQMANSLPLMKLLFRIPIVFYCHYPDKLLSKPGGVLKRLYRKPMDWLEEWSLGFADEIFVNSRYTADVFQNHFPRRFRSNQRPPFILYPGIMLNNYKLPESSRKDAILEVLSSAIVEGKVVILSLNRFERKKDIHLAIEGLYDYRQRSQNDNLILIIAGGYDPRVEENVSYHRELELVASKCHFRHETIWAEENGRRQCSEFVDVLFLPSISSLLRSALLSTASIVIYTPSHEHFGLVPIEAMASGSIVIAMASGGPKESIVNEESGFLVQPSGSSIGSALRQILEQTDSELDEMRRAARKRVESRFTMDQFTDQLLLQMKKHCSQ